MLLHNLYTSYTRTKFAIFLHDHDEYNKKQGYPHQTSVPIKTMTSINIETNKLIVQTSLI